MQYLGIFLLIISIYLFNHYIVNIDNLYSRCPKFWWFVICKSICKRYEYLWEVEIRNVYGWLPWLCWAERGLCLKVHGLGSSWFGELKSRHDAPHKESWPWKGAQDGSPPGRGSKSALFCSLYKKGKKNVSWKARVGFKTKNTFVCIFLSSRNLKGKEMRVHRLVASICKLGFIHI